MADNEEESVDFSEGDFEIDYGDEEYPDPMPEDEFLAVPMEVEDAEEGEITDIPGLSNEDDEKDMLEKKVVSTKTLSNSQDEDLRLQVLGGQTAGSLVSVTSASISEQSKRPALTASTELIPGPSQQLVKTEIGRKSLKSDRHMSRFVSETCRRLGEPKLALFWRALDKVGIETLQELLLEVDVIEKCGGQFTADGSRRRTPGGVLWNILKKRVSADVYKEVMCEEKKHQKAKVEAVKKQRILSETDNSLRQQSSTTRSLSNEVGNCTDGTGLPSLKPSGGGGFDMSRIRSGVPSAKPSTGGFDKSRLGSGSTAHIYECTEGPVGTSSHAMNERRGARGGKRKRKAVPSFDWPAEESEMLHPSARFPAQVDADSQPRPRAEWQQAWVQAVRKPNLLQERLALATVEPSSHGSQGTEVTEGNQMQPEKGSARDSKWANRLVFPSGTDLDSAAWFDRSSRRKRQAEDLQLQDSSPRIPLVIADRKGVTPERLSQTGRLASRIRMPANYDDL